MNFLDTFIRFLLDFIPLRTVRSYQLGVREVFGVAKRTLRPGVWLHIKFIFEVFPIDAAEQGLNLPTQSVTTKDGVAVAVSANISYDITDAATVHATVLNLDTTLVYEAMRTIARCIRRRSFAEIAARQGALENAIRRSLQKRVEPWGVRIIGVGVSDLVQARHYRLFGDPNTIPSG